MNGGEHNDDAIDDGISSEYRGLQRWSESTTADSTDNFEPTVVDRSPAAVRQRVIVDLRQRIAALSPPLSSYVTASTSRELNF